MQDISVFKDIVEQLPQAVVLLNKQKQIIYVNQQALQFWPDIMNLDRNFGDKTPDSLKLTEEKLISNAILHQKELSYIVIKEIVNTNLALFRADIKPLHGSDSVLIVLNVLQFFHKQKEIADKGLLLKVLDSASDAILFFHLNEYHHPVILYANKMANKLYGYHSSEWNKLLINDLWPNQSPDLIQMRVQLKVLKTDETWVYKSKHKNKRGIEFPVEMKMMKIGSNPMNLFFLECKHFEQETKIGQHFELMRSIFDSSPDVLIKADRDLFVLEANQIACIRFYTPYTKMLGAPLREVLLPAQYDVLEKYFTRAQSGIQVKEEIAFCYHDKKNARISIQILPEKQGSKVHSLILVIRDITESYALFQSVRESENRYKTLFENLSVGIVLHRLDGSLLSFNAEFSKMIGYSDHELASKTIFEFHSAKDCEFVKKSFSDLSFDNYMRFQMQLLRKDHQQIVVSVFARLVKLNDEVLVLATLQDITDRINTQEAFDKQKSLLELIINSIPMQLFWKSVNLEILGANKAFLEAFGYQHLNEILHKTDAELVADEQLRAIFLQSDIEVLETKKAIRDIEIETTDKFGKIRTTSTNKFPVFDDQENLVGILGIASDITERKAIMQQLLETEKKFQLLAENSVDAIWALDNNFKFVFNSKSSEKLFGYTLEERKRLNIQIENLYTKESLELIDRLFRQRADEYLNDSYSNRRIELELEAIHKDGHHFWVGVSAGFYFDSDGKVIGIQGISRDITAERLKRMELIKAKERAEESDSLKSAFLASVSHEIRTPLNAILGFSSLISPHKSFEKVLEYSKNIHKSALQLQKIIESIFHLALLQSKQAVVVLTEFSVRELILELKLYAQSEMNVLNKNLDLYLDIQTGGDLFIRTDRSKLLQILTNLVNNAIKFTEKGSVAIGFDLHESEIVFYVQDTGLGIPHDKSEFIFGRFNQIQKDDYSGTGAGLGLSIAKETTDLLGGKIWLQSELNKGSIFYLRLPLGKNS